MSKSTRELGELLGGKYVGPIPNLGGGSFAAARLANFYRERQDFLRNLSANQAKLQTGCTFEIALENETAEKLTEMAKHVSTSERNVSPNEVAAQLIRDAIAVYEKAQ